MSCSTSISTSGWKQNTICLQVVLCNVFLVLLLVFVGLYLPISIFAGGLHSQYPGAAEAMVCAGLATGDSWRKTQSSTDCLPLASPYFFLDLLGLRALHHHTQTFIQTNRDPTGSTTHPNSAITCFWTCHKHIQPQHIWSSVSPPFSTSYTLPTLIQAFQDHGQLSVNLACLHYCK